MNLRIPSFEAYQVEYKKSVESPESFWSDIASTFQWKKPWNQTLDWNFKDPSVKWFDGGQLNITENMLDRHLEKHGEDVAFYWEPNEPGDQKRSLTYLELYHEVCKVANGLKSLGIEKGDRVCIYMPMTLEAVISVIACARIGAVHSIVFAGFSAHALADRVNDAQAKLIITSDGLNRGTKHLNLKSMVDEALEHCSSVEKVLVHKHLHNDTPYSEGRDVDYQTLIDAMPNECPAEAMDSEDLLFILYTSGSTGKPKGVVHTCGGYMVYTAYSFQNVFQYEPGDVFWCTADIGWITGHSYIIYGPLLSGATSVIFEGIPTYPDAGRFWAICDEYNVNQFYTAPTAIRSLMGAGLDFVNPYNLDSLKVIGSVGEPINEEAWQWYNKEIGKEKCPVVDTWWQTETGGIMISGLGQHSPTKPMYAGYPLPGIQPVLLDQEGNEISENDVEGYLSIKHPWPSILRTTYGDHERCKNVYFSHYEGYYFTGDGAKRDKNGMFRIIGRVDDVINVSGHRFGTAEIEDAINTNKHVIESAVVVFPHPIKGQGIYAYVVVDTNDPDAVVELSVCDAVSEEIGKIARPDKIQVVPGLPKTRSGKIMRRILRKIAEGDPSNLGDTSTLLDPDVVQAILEKAK